MTKFYLLVAICLCLAACNSSAPKTADADTETKGELAFLLKYDGQMPSDVGFLTNHVVERRLANMMKDSFNVFMQKAMFDRPIAITADDEIITAMFFSDSDRTEASASVVIDVKNDAIWANYISGTEWREFADHPSLPAPESFEEMIEAVKSTGRF